MALLKDDGMALLKIIPARSEGESQPGTTDPQPQLSWRVGCGERQSPRRTPKAARAVPRTTATKAQNEGSHEKEGFKAKAKQAAPDRASGPTPKRLQHIAGDVLAQERRDSRVLDRQAERAAKTKGKPDSEREATMPPRHPNDDENDEPEIEEDDEDQQDDDPAIIREPDEDD